MWAEAQLVHCGALWSDENIQLAIGASEGDLVFELNSHVVTSRRISLSVPLSLGCGMAWHDRKDHEKVQ